MRLISQDGIFDLPYDHTLVEVLESRNRVLAEFEDCSFVLGEFDSKEKAMDELKKIRTAYASGRKIYKVGEL